MTDNIHDPAGASSTQDGAREVFLPGVGTAEPIFCESRYGVRVTGEGHLFRRFWPLKDHDKRSLSARLLGLRWSSLRDAYRRSTPALLRTAGREPEAFWVTDRESTNYWHWFFEVLPKLYLIARRDPAALVFLPHWLEASDYVRETISFLGLWNVRFLGGRSSVQVQHLRQLTKSHYHPELILGIRELVLSRFSRGSGPARVYISRNDAGKRRVLNEAEQIRPLLDARGFQTVEMSRLTFRQQVEAMLDCSVLVSMHGAGLTNMLFMPAGATVIEFRTNNPCFVRLAEILGLRHIAIHGSKSESNRSDHHSNWFIPPDDLDSALDLIIPDRNDALPIT